VIKTTIVGIATLLLFIACSKKQEPTLSPPAAITGTIPLESVSKFSGEKALAHVEALTAFGPRPPESQAYEKSLFYLEKYLAAVGWKTKRQSFKGITPTGPLGFTNLLARYSPDAEPDWSVSPPYLICSHLDTKRYRNFHFVGANDSGSSTGVLAELARALSASSNGSENIELVFFDGEEAILENIRGRDGLYGSRYYASQLNKRSVKPRLGIVLDIVGDPNIPLLIGGDSDKNLEAHTRAAATKLGIQDWVQVHRDSIIDDHVPLMSRANLPVLHLIGAFMEAPYWHKKNDTLDKITPGALENTGRLTLQVLHQLTK